MYDNGEGIPQNDKEAVRWYGLAAEQGLTDAQYSLGLMHSNGGGIPEDNKKAVKWFRLAAEQGYAKAQFDLGSAYEFGEGVPKDNKVALRLCTGLLILKGLQMLSTPLVRSITMAQVFLRTP